MHEALDNALQNYELANYRDFYFSIYTHITRLARHNHYEAYVFVYYCIVDSKRVHTIKLSQDTNRNKKPFSIGHVHHEISKTNIL